MTNYEKIKSMSIEEMAKKLLNIEYRARILGAKRFDELIEWLESEKEKPMIYIDIGEVIDSAKLWYEDE